MKPLTRGYIHNCAFFIALIVCSILIAHSHSTLALTSNIIYSMTLIGLLGISALYHCHVWTRQNYIVMKRIDHGAIFALIAGTATPVCLLGIKGDLGWFILVCMWLIASLGMLTTLFWIHAPKWFRAFLYVAMGWFVIVYFPEVKSSLGTTNVGLLVVGGILYTLGALIYALKRPDPYPHIFGYHEIFHILVVIACCFHFVVIYHLVQ